MLRGRDPFPSIVLLANEENFDKCIWFSPEISYFSQSLF